MGALGGEVTVISSILNILKFIFMPLMVTGGTLSRKNNIIRNQKLKGQAYHCQEPLGFLVPYLSRTPKSQRDIMRSPHPITLLQHRSRFLQH